ncbi:MAG: heavy-metal-associated domain-containing protein [Acidimicrobiia bacterium]
MKTEIYTVEDIHCKGCETTIRTLVGDVAGVQQVDPDHRTNQVVVMYDEAQVDDITIRDVLADAGFSPRDGEELDGVIGD